MHKINVINNINRVSKYVEWCNTNLNNNEWNLKLLSMSPLHYTFEFKDPHIQLICALKH